MTWEQRGMGSGAARATWMFALGLGLGLGLLAACGESRKARSSNDDDGSSASSTSGSGGAGGAVGNGGGGMMVIPGIPAECNDLINCAIQDGTVPLTPLLEQYGENGTCYDEFPASACAQDCVAIMSGLSCDGPSGSGGAGGGPNCETACNTLYACGVDMNRCPNFGDGPNQIPAADFVPACVPACRADPASFLSLIDGNDCDSTISTFSSVSPDFAALCSGAL